MRKFTRKIKRSTKQYITVCIIAVIVAAVAAAVISSQIISSIKKDYVNKLSMYEKERSENQRMVYRATEDLKAGDIITHDNIEYVNMYAQQDVSYIDVSDIGKMVLIDVNKGSQLLKSMVTDVIIDDGIREAEFSTIMISSNIIENDVIDVRIAYPNGEDYCILAKKVIKNYTGETPNCFLWLTEEEIIRMHNAIVDAYLFTGSYLYTTKYIESNLQEATIVTYTPSVQAIELIKKNPNIIVTATATLSNDVRKALENRLAKSLKKDVTIPEWSIDNEYLYPEFIVQQQESVEDQFTDSDSNEALPIGDISQNEEIHQIDNYDNAPENEDNRLQYPETGKVNESDIIGGKTEELGYNNMVPVDYLLLVSEEAK